MKIKKKMGTNESMGTKIKNKTGEVKKMKIKRTNPGEKCKPGRS